MWVVMMVAMMLPSLVPMLRHYRQALGARDAVQLAGLTSLVALGYYFVWTAIGIALYPMGIALAALEMRHAALARGVPIAAGLFVLIAGFLQFTLWKRRHLSCCREMPGRRGDRGVTMPADAGTAWRHGLRLGIHCSQCCAGLIAILLAIGIM